MTVMTTSTRELDISTLVLTAYQYAGVMNEMQTAQGPQWDARSRYGRQQLEVIIDGLAADGIYERSMELYDLAVTAGDRRTELPGDTIDVRGDVMLVDDDGNITGVPVRAIGRSAYNAIAMPEQTGAIPSQFFVERTAPMYLYLWPVPEADLTLRLQRQRLTYDNSSGSATVDLERFWSDFLVHELATRVALSNGMPTERVTLLQAKAIAAKTAARGKASDQLSNQFILNHRGPYRR